MGEAPGQRPPSNQNSNIPEYTPGRIDVGDVQRPPVNTPATEGLIKQIQPLPNLPIPRPAPTEENK